MRPFYYLLCLFLPLVSPAQSDPGALHFDADRLARVDSFLQDLVDRGIVPNAQAYVAHRGEVVLRSTIGLADLDTRRPARPDDIYRIASQTKALVTVGLMKLYERGKFLLEDPIARYIPAFADVRVIDGRDSATGEWRTVPAERPITIRHLLTHTSGLGYELPGDLDQHYPVPLFASLEEETTEEVVDRIARRPLLAQPGTEFVYGLSTDVIGRLVEILSGQALDDYMQQEVFGPLGMQDSYFYLPQAKADRLVSLYSKPEGAGALEPHANDTFRLFPVAGAQTYFSAGAGSVGTIDDYARFCQMLLNGGQLHGVRILSPTTVAFMTRNHIGDLEVWDRRDKFGLGFMIITDQSHYGDLASPGAYKWGGMYCSEYTIDPARDLIMLVYFNVHPIPQYAEVLRKFRILVYQAMVD
ncbi:CubicO group peptidase (beta-lactamase class C family) [Neolewinella xylanilytica]|uniref:CubicO group peptidase (Beta-lactamase class C family) n=1 Tax=Neolewinella xylanilytica TaxID=1514080 RepID=A0A2S6I9P6_9BACT|nr:serine hydrolase domain-containing protein [Neolewinella xylanilytica]PPK88211.1 CubicO group peptidase (beta-lactamase class C family) [Neolewinella xylanilytica]